MALVLMLLVSVLGCLVGAAHPLSPESPVRLDIALAVVGVATSALVFLVPRRAVFHVGCVVSLAGTALLVSQSATPVGSATTSFSFVWISLYAAVFFGRWVARLYAGTAAAALAAALLIDPYPGAPQVGIMSALTFVVASEVLASHVGQLHRTSVTDPLTGALNRAGLDRASQRVFATAGRTSSTVAVAVIDLDGFKTINDELGHHAGDALLRDFTTALRDELRETDVVSRHGGDEFVLLLPGADSRHVDTIARRVRRISPVAWSVGAVTTYGDEDLTAVLRRADKVLYRDKAVRREARVPAPRAPLAKVGAATT